MLHYESQLELNMWGLRVHKPLRASVAVWRYGRREPVRMAKGFALPMPLRSRVDMRKLLSEAALFVVIGAALFALVNTDRSALRYGTLRLLGQTLSAEDFAPEWIAKYHIVITDRVTGESDADGDGLNFLEEYALRTHPFQADTDQDGVSDGVEVTTGMNPLGVGERDQDGDGLSDNWEKEHGLNAAVSDAALDSDSDGLSNKQEYAAGTDPQSADTDRDGFADGSEVRNGYDPTVSGDAKPQVTVLLNKMDIAAPLVWSEDATEAALLRDLEKGVVRYPKTGVPGQSGNLVIAGHSSNYIWAKGEYNSVFRDLGNLELGDTVLIRQQLGNGKVFEYTYRITEERVVNAADPWIFEEDTDKGTLTLSTCWPVGTTLSRLTLRAELESAPEARS